MTNNNISTYSPYSTRGPLSPVHQWLALAHNHSSYWYRHSNLTGDADLQSLHWGAMGELERLWKETFRGEVM